MENKVFNVLGKNIQMRAALIDGENYIRLRDLEKVSMFKSPYDEKPNPPV